jgi:hypothetical protein
MSRSNCYKTLSWGLFFHLFLWNLSAIAEPNPLAKQPLQLSEQIIFLENFEPPGEGAPEDTSGAGSRDGWGCNAEEPALRAIVPERNYGLTLNERPTIFVDLGKTSARQVLLSFRDPEGDYYHRVRLPIEGNSEISSFRLPEDAPPLSVGNNYQWMLTAICGETPTPDDPVLTGWVQRVDRTAEIATQLAEKTPLERVQWYAAGGYWYDMVATLERSQQSASEDPTVTTLWENLLKSVGF